MSDIDAINDQLKSPDNDKGKSSQEINVSSWIPPYENQNWLIPGLDKEQNIKAGVRYLWNIYFKNFVKVSEDTWAQNCVINTDPDSLNAITNQQFWTAQFQHDFKAWYNQLSPTTLQSSFTSTATPWYKADAAEMAVNWQSYLISENVKQRTFSSFMYVFNALLKMLEFLNSTVVQHSDRMSSITTGEKKAVSAMSKMVDKFAVPSSTCDHIQLTNNQQYQLWIQTYQGWQSFDGSKITQNNNMLSQSNESLENQQTVMSGLIQQIEAILSGIFR